MNKRITFRNMDHAESIENYANEHLVKIEKFLENEPLPITIDLLMEPSKTREHNRVELRVKTPHYDLISHHEGPQFYKVLDHVLDVMLESLRQAKLKRLDGRNEQIKVGKLWEFQEEIPGDESDEE